MPQVENIEIIGTAPPDAGPGVVTTWFRRTLTGWLGAGLALSLTAVAVLGTVAYRDHRATRSPEEREAIAAVMRWVAAENAHDLAAARASMTSTGSIEYITRSTIASGPYTGETFSRVTQKLFDDDLHLDVVAGPVAGRGNSADQVWLFGHTTTSHDDRYNYHVFHLRRESGALKIDEIVVTN